MVSYCTNYTATMPDVTVFINCDTRLAIDLRNFNLGKNDEFIFVIKNYSYIESPYVFLYRAKVEDMDTNGEIFIKITPATSKRIKPGAFYNLAVLKNAFDPKQETEYKKLTDNGNIRLEYGAQDILVYDDKDYYDNDIVGVRLEPTDEVTAPNANTFMGEITGMRLELLDKN